MIKINYSLIIGLLIVYWFLNMMELPLLFIIITIIALILYAQLKGQFMETASQYDKREREGEALKVAGPPPTKYY